MRRLWPVVVLFASGCTVDRLVPLESFACASPEACDAGEKVARDAGMIEDRDGGMKAERDGGPAPDVPIYDGGEVPLPSCPGIERLPASGVALGSTTNATNGYEGGCYPMGGKDIVFGFTLPGRLANLMITSAGSSFDTAVHLYRDDCGRPSQLVCADETDTEELYSSAAEFRLTDVPAGAYAVVVDGYVPEEAGDFVLRVTGKIAPNEICDPSQQYLTCLVGRCTAGTDGVPRCPAVLDCTDGIDADRDGTVDEDGAACTNPPAVTCSRGTPELLDRPTSPSALVNDDGMIVYREWTAEAVPFGSYAEPHPRDAEGTNMLLDIAGSYRLRYTAADDDHQLSACELTIDPVPTSLMRAELIWSPEKPRFMSTELMFLHLLHPSANRWFHETLDCAGTDCFDTPLDWDTQGDFLDDPLWLGFIYGPQRAFVEDPITSGRYAFGVHLIDLGGFPSVEATARIFCNGVLKAEYGPVTLTNGNYATQDMNDFWKIAEVAMDPSGDCQVFPFGDGTNVIVRATNAMNQR